MKAAGGTAVIIAEQIDYQLWHNVYVCVYIYGMCYYVLLFHDLLRQQPSYPILSCPVLSLCRLCLLVRRGSKLHWDPSGRYIMRALFNPTGTSTYIHAYREMTASDVHDWCCCTLSIGLCHMPHVYLTTHTIVPHWGEGEWEALMSSSDRYQTCRRRSVSCGKELTG